MSVNNTYTTYNTLDLLKKAYNEIDTIKNGNNYNRLSLTRPEVAFMNKRTFIKNFGNICDKLNKNTLEIKSFFENELNAVMTIDGNNMLVITGNFKQKNIEKVLSNYITKYMMCTECKSTDTEIIKENRINFMNCKKCLSKKSISL